MVMTGCWPCAGALAFLVALAPSFDSARGEGTPARTYRNQLKPVVNPGPILADYPDFVEPIRETARFEAPVLV